MPCYELHWIHTSLSERQWMGLRASDWLQLPVIRKEPSIQTHTKSCSLRVHGCCSNALPLQNAPIWTCTWFSKCPLLKTRWSSDQADREHVYHWVIQACEADHWGFRQSTAGKHPQTEDWSCWWDSCQVSSYSEQWHCEHNRSRRCRMRDVWSDRFLLVLHLRGWVQAWIV